MNFNDPVGDAQSVMAYRHGQPVYYGTDQAKALALQGLKNVAAAHGTHSPQWRAAVNAALGVLGPDFQAPAGAFSPAALAISQFRQAGPQGLPHPPLYHPPAPPSNPAAGMGALADTDALVASLRAAVQAGGGGRMHGGQAQQDAYAAMLAGMKPL